MFRVQGLGVRIQGPGFRGRWAPGVFVALGF